jgi:hypothetical protein
VALALSYCCTCGRRYKIYVPKQKVFGETISRSVDWQAVDAREEAHGEVDEVRRVADVTGCTFVDGRHTARLVCPGCAAEIDFFEQFRSRLTRV